MYSVLTTRKRGRRGLGGVYDHISLYRKISLEGPGRTRHFIHPQINTIQCTYNVQQVIYSQKFNYCG